MRDLFGMSGRPRSRALGVDTGLRGGVSEGVRGAPQAYKNIHFYSHPSANICFCLIQVGRQIACCSRGGLASVFFMRARTTFGRFRGVS
jgi:hypothetical protein